MPVTYTCDNCGATATSLDGWSIVSVSFLHDTATASPPGGRTLDATAPDKIFHAAACLDAWCTAASVTPPVAPA